MAFGKLSFSTFSKVGDKSSITNSTLSSITKSILAIQFLSSNALIVGYNNATFLVLAMVITV